MSEWKEYKFSDFVMINPSVSLPKAGQISFVEMKDLEDGKRYCEPSQERALSGGSRFQERDTLFARITPCLENGKICQVKNLKNGVGLGSTEFHVFRGREKISDTDFIYYLSRWSDVRDHAEINLDGTSGRQRVPKQAFDDLILNMPEPAEQKAIASILSSLDDKIDLLHRQNATLEKMAETLFRQWFVEEAKEEWEEGNIYNFIDVVYGFPFKSKYFNAEQKGLPLIRIRDLKDGYSNIYTDEECDDKFIIHNGDLVAGMDGEFRLYIWSGVKSVLNQRACKFVPKYDYVPKFYVFSIMKPHLHYYENTKVGTTVIHLGKSDIDDIKISIPPKELLVKYGNITNKWFDKIRNNNNQIRTLTTLRDTLLPKLMSGEVRVAAG